MSDSITLPPTYTVVPPKRCVGNILTGTVITTVIPISTVVSLCTIYLTPAMWSVTGNIFNAAKSGTVSTTTTMYSTRNPTVGYIFGSTANTHFNIPITILF